MALLVGHFRPEATLNNYLGDAIMDVFAELFWKKYLLQWQSLRFSAIVDIFLNKNNYYKIYIARWRYHFRFRRALSTKMYIENYWDFQRFLLFRNKARNAGRSCKNVENKPTCGISGTIAERLTPMVSHVRQAWFDVLSTLADTGHCFSVKPEINLLSLTNICSLSSIYRCQSALKVNSLHQYAHFWHSVDMDSKLMWSHVQQQV